MNIKGSVWGLLIVLAASQATGCEQEEAQRECTLAGCGPQVMYRTTLLGSLDEIRQYTVQACLDEQCREISFAELPKELGPGTGHRLSDPSPQKPRQEGSDRLEAIISRQDGGHELGVEWWPWDGTPGEKERFRLTLTNAAGEKLIDEDRSLAYTQYEPNGPGCGVCYSAGFEGEPVPGKSR